MSDNTSFGRHSSLRDLYPVLAFALLTACSESPLQPAAPGSKTMDNAAPAVSPAIVVSSAAELQAALAGATAGSTILVEPGSYVVGAPLIVPDGVTLQGNGIMQGDDLPTGFEAGSETRILAAAGFAGDLLTLGDSVTLRGLIIEDVVGRGGNVITIGSSGAGSQIATSIEECEIRNPKASGTGPSGPAGRAIAIFTRIPAHGGSTLALNMTRSIVRSTSTGDAIFGINFAARSSIYLTLTGNVVAGPTTLTGGVARPAEVRESAVAVTSKRNLYTATGTPALTGWHLIGGSDVPVPGLVAGGSFSNSMTFHSSQDRVEGFRTGILAVGGRRWNSTTGLSSDNRVDLNLQGLVIATVGTGAADWKLHAAETGGGFLENLPGNGNSIRVVARGITGSGARLNSYRNVFGPALPANQGIGNRLEVVGNLQAFNKTNSGIDPAPAAEFFTSGK